MPIKLPALAPNPFQPTAPTTGALNVIQDPSVTGWKPSSTLDTEAAPKTDWWSLAMKVGAPLIGGIVGGKAGLRAGTAFATGVMEQEAAVEKARIADQERKAEQARKKQRDQEDADARARQRELDREAKNARDLSNLVKRRDEALDAKQYEVAARLYDEADKLRGVPQASGVTGKVWADQKKAEDDAKQAQNEQQEKDANARRKSQALTEKLKQFRLQKLESGGGDDEKPKSKTQLENALIGLRTGIVQAKQNIANAKYDTSEEGPSNVQYAEQTLAMMIEKEKRLQAEYAAKGGNVPKVETSKIETPKIEPPLEGPPEEVLGRNIVGQAQRPTVPYSPHTTQSALSKPTVTDTTDVTPEEYSTLQTVVANFIKNGLTPQQIRAKLIARKVGEETLKRLGL